MPEILVGFGIQLPFFGSVVNQGKSHKRFSLLHKTSAYRSDVDKDRWSASHNEARNFIRTTEIESPCIMAFKNKNILCRRH